MSPENRSHIPNNERAIKAMDRSQDQSPDPSFIALPISDEGHVIEGHIDEIVHHPNALDGLQYASRTFWEAQGFDELSIEKNVTNQATQARAMLERLNSPVDLSSMKRREKAAVKEKIDKARTLLQTIFRETHNNYSRLVENVQPQPIQEPSPVTVFSAQEHRNSERI